MKFLVTGGAGFIGSTLALELTKKYPAATVVATDNFWSGNFKNLLGFTGQFLPFELDSMEFISFLESSDFDAVFHMGAISDTTVEDQYLMTRVNILAFKRMVKVCLNRNIPLIYASSASVYGKKPGPNRLEEGNAPANVYAFSKMMMDRLTYETIAMAPSFPLVGLRFFNVYGKREESKGKFASMVYQLSVKMSNGENPRLFEMGEQKRDFVYIKDVVDGIISAYESKKNGVYNLGCGKAYTFNRLVEIINGVLGTDVKVEYFKNPYDFYQDHTEAALDESIKIGYAPKWLPEEGIADLIKEFQDSSESQ
ncbi:ADP-glyceromanno-heptose 6-epimerase [bacterium]|nr:ADP-glyceromanno-heptose 6-epimerase [bacterium]